MTDFGAWIDPYETQRTYNGFAIAHEEITVKHWIGGIGYVPTTMIKCWNPANPARWIVHTPETFEAITEPAN